MVEGIKVVSSKQTEEFLPDGGMRTVYRVHVRTARGAEGVLIVEPVTWTAEKLPAILAKKRDELDLAFVVGNAE